MKFFQTKHYLLILICGLFLFSLLLTTNPISTAPTNKFESLLSPGEIQLTIDTAFYSDLDSDDLEDDVYCGVIISMGNMEKYTIDYYISLRLPSGATFDYYYVIKTKVDKIYVENIFLDHAIESGDYTVSVQAYLRTGGGTLASQTLTFDPPGGSNGADPLLLIQAYSLN